MRIQNLAVGICPKGTRHDPLAWGPERRARQRTRRSKLKQESLQPSFVRPSPDPTQMPAGAIFLPAALPAGTPGSPSLRKRLGDAQREACAGLISGQAALWARRKSDGEAPDRSTLPFGDLVFQLKQAVGQ